MKYVLDASVALKWLFSEPDSAAAHVVREDYLAGRTELAVPDIYAVELAHVISKAHRRALISEDVAGELLLEALASMPPVFATASLLAQAFELSLRFRTGVYDCLYLALADQLHCELLTADEKLLAKFASFPVVDLASYSAH